MIIISRKERTKKINMEHLLLSQCFADSLLLYAYRYVKEGRTVSVIGVVQRNENVLMIVPPSEPFSTGCQWLKCILLANLDGIV